MLTYADVCYALGEHPNASHMHAGKHTHSSRSSCSSRRLPARGLTHGHGLVFAHPVSVPLLLNDAGCEPCPTGLPVRLDFAMTRSALSGEFDMCPEVDRRRFDKVVDNALITGNESWTGPATGRRQRASRHCTCCLFWLPPCTVTNCMSRYGRCRVCKPIVTFDGRGPAAAWNAGQVGR